MNRFLIICLALFNHVCLAQVGSLSTGMPSSFCQVGSGDLNNGIHIPLSIKDTNQIVHSIIKVLDYQSSKLDSVYISPLNSNYYAVHAVIASQDSIVVAGSKGGCQGVNSFFIGYHDKSSGLYTELKSLPISTNNDIIKGVFNAGNGKKGVYTADNVYVFDFASDTVYNVFTTSVSIVKADYINNKILVAGGSGFYGISGINYSVIDTIINENIRLLEIDRSEGRIYTVSNFFIFRHGKSLMVRDTLKMVNTNLNVGAPNFMDARQGKLYLLDGNDIHFLDSNFSAVGSPISIGLRNQDTFIKNFWVKDGYATIIGAKGHFYSSNMSSPWFLGTYHLGNSNPSNLHAELTKVGVDSLFKYKSGGQDYINARFNFSLKNKSASFSIQKFTVSFFLQGVSCSSYNNQELINNLNLLPGAIISDTTAWLRFGPFDNIQDFNSLNTKFNCTASAINNSDYGSTSSLSLATNSYGFIGTEELFNDITISPNPTDGIIRASGITESVNATIFNSMGQVLWEGQLSQEQPDLDLSEYPQGTYLLHLFCKNKYVTNKILKF